MSRYFAEFIGTFVLVFAGCGSAVLAGDKIGFLGISLAFGLSLLTMAYAIGHISGCHINPAVTLGLFLRRKITAIDAAYYAVAQVAGAILGALVVLIIAKGQPGGYDPTDSGLGANATAAPPARAWGRTATAPTRRPGTTAGQRSSPRSSSRCCWCSSSSAPPTSRRRSASPASPSASCWC